MTTEGHRLFEVAIGTEHGAAAKAARTLGLEPTRITRIRQGQVPGLPILLKIEAAYGIPPPKWTEPPTPPAPEAA